MGMKQYRRHSRHITRQPRWKALRMQALERDEWRCVQCGARRRLEVDHIKPVKTHPELAWDLNNLQVLCGRCHGRKTRLEVGMTPLSPQRQQWRDLLKHQHPPIEHERTKDA